MSQDQNRDRREAEELRRALSLIGVAAVFAVITAAAVVGVGSSLLQTSSPEPTLILIADR